MVLDLGQRYLFISFEKADGDPQKLRNVSAMELNLIRTSVVEVLNKINQLKNPPREAP